MAEEIIKEEIIPAESVITTDPEPKPKPKPKPNPYTKKVYDNLLDAYGQDNLPTYELFSEKIIDPKYRYAVHENLLDLYGAASVPDFKGFNDSLDVVIPEKKNLVATGADGYAQLESALKSIPRTEPFDKNANPVALARQAYDLQQKEVNNNVALDMSGMPVQSSTDYNPDKIKIASDIEKHLDEQGFPKDFRESLQRVRNLPNKNYIDPNAGAYGNDEEIVKAYKEDPDNFTKRIHRDLWQENLNQNFYDLANQWVSIDGKENEEANKKEFIKIGENFNKIGSGIFDLNQTLENRQYYIKQASDAIKQYIRNPKEQQQALQDLAISTSGSFGTLEDYTNARLKPIGNLNEWQTMGLNYFDRMDSKSGEFYRQDLDTNPENFQSSYEQAGHEQKRKKLEETGLQLFINNAQQELNQLSKKANQQGNVLDEEDLNKYNDLSQRVKEATDRLNNLPDLYPYAKDVETYQIAQELTDNGNSMFGNAARKLKGGLLNIGGTVANLGADIFGSKETQNRMALKTLGLSTESEIETMPTRAQSALVRPMPKIDKDLQQQINKVNNDNTLTKDQRTEKVDLLLQQNKDKWTPSSAETSWNLSATAVVSTVLNTAVDLAPFIATMALTEGMAAGAPAILPKTLSSFTKMFSAVALTSYNQELAQQMKANNPDAENAAWGNIFVNSLAFKAAGVGEDLVKYVRGAASKAGGMASNVIGKMSDKEILNAVKNPNSTLKGFLNNAKDIIPRKALTGAESATTFEAVMLGKDILEGKEINKEMLKEHALNALSFALLNTIGGAGLEMVTLENKNKRDLYTAALHKDEVLYELDKAKANGKMTNEAYNQAKQNVEAAAKVLEKTPMVDENGKKLKEKEAIELMTRKIQSQLMQDNMKKELPEKLKKKMADEWLKNEEKINDIYKGNFSEETGKPFAGLEERVAKRKIEEEKAPEVKPTEEIVTTETVEPIEEFKPEQLFTPEDIKRFNTLPGYNKYGPKNNMKPSDLGLDYSTVKNGKDLAEKLAEIDGPLKPLLTAISRMPGLKRVEVMFPKDLVPTKAGTSAASYNNTRAAFDIIPFKSITMTEYPHYNAYIIGTHELIHWVTLGSKFLEPTNPEMKTLHDIYNYISNSDKYNKTPKSSYAGSKKLYGLFNFHEFMTELFTNEDFRKEIEDIAVKNKEEFFKGIPKKYYNEVGYEKGFRSYIYNVFKEFINKILGAYKDPKIDYDKSLADNAIDLMAKMFFGEQKYNIAKEGDIISRKLKPEETEVKKPVEVSNKIDENKIELPVSDITIENSEDGHKITYGDESNSIGDISKEAEEHVAKENKKPEGEKKDPFFTKEKIENGKKIFTVVKTKQDKDGKVSYRSVSISFPEDTKVTMKDVEYDLTLNSMRGDTNPVPINIDKNLIKPIEEVKSTEITPIPEIKDFTLGYAPFKEGKITDISQGEKAFDNKAFKAWKKMANTFAENIGLEIVSDNNTIGKYGATSTIGEASSVPTVRGTKEQVELFAALMGTLAPEGQHSVMTLEYNPNGKTEEHRITFKDRKAAQEFLENSAKYGIEDISLFPESNTVMILDNGNVDHKTLNNDYENRITGHKRLKVNQDFITQDRYSGLLQKYGDSLGGRYPSAYGENITDAIQLAKERAGRFGSDYDQKSKQAQVEAQDALKNYIDKNKKALDLPDTEETIVKKVDPAFAKKISDAYDALPVDDSKNPEVIAAYNKAIEEIDKQFQFVTKDLGIKVEFIKDDPYKNSDEMFEDIIKNKRIKVYQGGEPHPFMGESSKDASGFTATEKFRAVHDIIAHFIGRNQFGKVGEEAAWVEHSKTFSPLAQRAISTETRGQNAWVNFSGVNDVAIEKMKQGNDLIKEGKITEGNKLIAEGQAEFKYAEQKVALMPEELTDWYQYTERGKAPKTKVKIQEPEIEEVQPVKTPQQVEISKRALGENYNFSKEFDVRGGDIVATDVLTEVTKRAEENNVDVPTQRAIEVNRMADGNAEPTEYNIITAGSHLLSIDKKIDIAQNTGNLVEVENLTQQREQVLSVLRNLGNKAGRNLGLFNLVFQETDRSEIKLTRDHLKNILKVEEVPETIAELDKSNLTAEQKKTVRPYVEKIEKAKAQFNSIEKEVNSSIVKINDQEINAALDKARSEGKKQGFEEGLKSASNDVKQKKSKQLKDLASKIRISDEYDKFLKGSDGKNIEKMGIDFGTYKEMVANVIDAVAKAVELGENLTDALRKAVDKFKDIDKEKLIKDAKTIISKSQLPDAKETLDAINKLAKAEGITNINKTLADKGLIKDIVNSYLGEELTNDQVLDAATKDLKSILPDVTREDVADAYAERNQFKKQTKAKLEDEINKKKADVRRLAVKEARLRALEAANDYHAEESTQNKKAVRSEYEAELDEKIKALLKEKSDAQKVQKTSKSPKTEQDKIDEINREIEYVKTTKSVYEQAIKNPKKASDALIAAREERAKTYADLGLKLEKNAKSPILIERDYQETLLQIERSDLSIEEKNDKKEELKAQRDLDLLGTKQFVVSSLSSDLDAVIESSMEKAVDATIAKDQETANSNLIVKDKLQDIKDLLNPTGEKIDDQINKAYDKLNELLVDEKITKESKVEIKQLIKDLKNNNQLASDQLSAQRLKKQWENEIRTAETDIAAGNFTKIPSNTYDFRRNDELVRLNKARENKSGQFNRLVADAKEKNRTNSEKAIDITTKGLVSGVHTTAKVAEAATFKPFMDNLVDVTLGYVGAKLSGAPYTSLYSVKKGLKTFAAFKNKESAEQYINKLKDNRDYALKNLEDAYENGNEGDIKKADKEFKKADLEYAVSTLYNSIESNVLSSFWQYMKHGATDYDVSIGKSTKKDISDYRTILGKTGYVLDGWIRMHGAMKSSLSARPEMMKWFSATLKDFQNKGMELSPENISTAMVIAADAYEAGRLTNKNALSKMISRGKGSEKSLAMRLITKTVVPVSTIATNLAKRGIDYSTLGSEGFVRLATETKKGMKLNEIDGKTYDSLIGAIKDGWKQIPLKERIYISGVIGRGLFGAGIMLATAYGLANGSVKYGGTYEDQKKRKIMGSDKQPLGPGEWEFFGKRLPKAASLFVNHLPEFLSVSLIANNYQINQMGGDAGDKFSTTIDEIEARLPFQTVVGLLNSQKTANTIADRFTRFTILSDIGGFFDEKGEFRDKKDLMNRIRGNVGLGAFNPTKKQQEQIDIIYDRIRQTPDSLKTPKFKASMNKAIETLRNVDFKEVEVKKATEKAMEEARKAMEAEKNKKN